MVKEAIKKANVLIEALPYIKKFHNNIFLIKYGGSILTEDKVRRSVFEDIAFLRFMGIKPILVHGGGPNITEKLKELKIPSEFVDGIRVTSKAVLNVVETELNKLNNLIVHELNEFGINAVGFKSDSKLLSSTRKQGTVDLGLVGTPIDFNREKLNNALKTSVPVIVPIGTAANGETHNINADDAAFFLAAKLKAEKLVLLTKVLGVMRDPADEETLISTITADKAEELIKNKVIAEGMVPKIRAAVQAIEEGVGKAHIVDAKIPHGLLLEIFTNEGIGTEIIK